MIVKFLNQAYGYEVRVFFLLTFKYNRLNEIVEYSIVVRLEIDALYAAFLTLSSFFTVVVMLLAVVQLYHVVKYVSNTRIQSDLYYLVLMFPITTLCNVTGMFIPRAALFLYAVALVYFMFCLFIVVSLLFNIFGSRKEMSDFLLERNIRISFRVAPLCCLKILPSVSATDRNLRRVEWLVLQTPILRTTFELISVLVFMELGHRHNLWFMFSQLFGIISMCVAFYGCYVIVPLGKTKVAPYRFITLFTIVDIAQCLYTIQKFCFDFAAVFEIISPDRLLTATAKAQFWASFMLTWEMMTLSAIATYALRPSRSIFFDKYPIIDSVLSTSVMTIYIIGLITSNNQTVNNFMVPSPKVEPQSEVVFDTIDCNRFGISGGTTPEIV
ncbi:organic solute transporter alpha-like protein C01B12.4 family protein [Dictyocaulus viviparus]|uniref:Organic solute transporter alpha-like protein C01B12.4 family protein n=1 Tax=Dictyocaulus viviparus TaxID=29172 RepID=A0A0D8XXE1_DICVI|nr:organic solute transporter alpha-like protein C01B12.4 family protein [Dictyocaulus viviparus]